MFRPITALNYKRISKLSKNKSFISFLSLLGIVITELFIPTAPFLVQILDQCNSIVPYFRFIKLIDMISTTPGIH